MKLSKSVYERLFVGAITFLVANVFMFFAWLVGVVNTEVRILPGVIIGLFIGFIVNNKMNNIPYDEYDNDNRKFLIILFISISLMIIQGVMLK